MSELLPAAPYWEFVDESYGGDVVPAGYGFVSAYGYGEARAAEAELPGR